MPNSRTVQLLSISLFFPFSLSLSLSVTLFLSHTLTFFLSHTLTYSLSLSLLLLPLLLISFSINRRSTIRKKYRKLSLDNLLQIPLKQEKEIYYSVNSKNKIKN